MDVPLLYSPWEEMWENEYETDVRKIFSGTSEVKNWFGIQDLRHERSGIFPGGLRG